MEHTVRAGTVLLAACAALAACSSGSSTAAGTTSTSVSSSPAVTTSSAAATTSPAPTSSPAPATSAPPATSKPAATTSAAATTLVLEPDGIGYVVGESSVRHLPFGSAAGPVRTLLASALGGKLTSNDLPECGQGPRSSAGRNGFTVLLDGTTFVGWTDQGAKGRRLTTLDGLGVGSRLSEVKESLPGVTVSDGSLGAEFTDEGGGFGGILSGMTPASKVTVLYAGETCFFR